ncbi:MAG TPA: alpha/beta hydrolase [Dehalococcoidia bacterium]|nr:alpha/beta hydrolase [Dehalococcoidia bacterium]
METVRSKDGTAIAFERSGSGPPLVLVHGTTADHTRWAPVLPELERHFTVLAMDRRGRGGSGDSETYDIEREYEDVAAVVDAAGPGTSLLGHSYGALCSLEAALRTPNLRKLVLYEPPFPVDGIEIYAPGLEARLQALLDAGDREAMLTTFFREAAGASEQEMAALKAAPSWQARLAAAHTALREFADAEYVFDAGRIANLKVPTLLLVGGASPPSLTRPSAMLAAALPEARVAVMPGQGHTAMNTAPDLFVREVLSFLTA